MYKLLISPIEQLEIKEATRNLALQYTCTWKLTFHTIQVHLQFIYTKNHAVFTSKVCVINILMENYFHLADQFVFDLKTSEFQIPFSTTSLIIFLTQLAFDTYLLNT